ncbi:ferric reductase like transmembrane component-domain-containing protein [Fusarium flagelliforme]|uniref:ferric reductase like transmembrane component-domain-containing protein n=1 Tax=Fusarium flagelliforme TaxID=2675880 RepID=UPI001E8DEBAE|nr:ferric reductase like transmembrane component-domain-containing protein [Fusarium flagelliforme]KAH7192828.1 ferric reductase like transmembrane component-domain-containing protein [Fusarium flagelliforme]
MRLSIPGLALAAIFPHELWAHVTTGRERQGVIGYGITMYDPPCAYGCIDTVKSWPLQCDGDHGMDHDMSSTPECKATNDAFLATLAWCFHTHCPDIKNSTLERVWEMDIVGRKKVQPSPKFSYQVALALAYESPPTEIVDSEAVLNKTSLVDEAVWQSNFNADYIFEKMEAVTEKYGIILMVICVAIPIILSWIECLPLPPSVVSNVYATFIDPPLFGSYHSVPVLGLGFVPTRGQGIFIAFIWIVNIILCAVGYELKDPMSWFNSLDQQLVSYISNRVGLLSFVNLALAVLFSSRNNVLLWVTNWSYSTYVLVHRWIAVICMLQACLHSAIYLQIYLDPAAMGEGAHDKQAKEQYWIWGIVATLSLVLLIPFSILPFRQKFYEAFLASHVVLALLAMIGCMLHIFYRYEWQWGYQTWVWIAFAFWIFDRFLARPIRMVRNGIKRAQIELIDDDYLRIMIPKAEGDGHVYIYFPSLTWRIWENHPFSVAAISSRPYPPHRAESADIEGSYGPQASIIPHSSAIEFPNIICIAGGVGITGVLPYIDSRPSMTGLRGKKKLLWGVRTEPLVEAVRSVIPRVTNDMHGQELWNDFGVAISVGKRFDVDSVLQEELNGVTGGTIVAVCGPPGMADDVRIAVTKLGQQGLVVKLVEESFAW